MPTAAAALRTGAAVCDQRGAEGDRLSPAGAAAAAPHPAPALDAATPAIAPSRGRGAPGGR